MRCHPKRVVSSAFVCSILYFMTDRLFYSQDYQPVQQPLENMRFNQIQVRESNLVMAIGPRPLQKPEERANNFFNAMPLLQKDEASYIKTNRHGLRELNKKTTAQNDPRLLQIIKNYWIREPSYKLYQLDDPLKTDFSMGQSPIVDRLLNHKKGGFFVECGGLDGETRSNSLFFERERNWNGLLIEAGPLNYRKLIEKNRKAYASPACLSTQPYPNVMYFHRGKNRGRLINDDEAYNWVHNQDMHLWLMEVQCFPLYSFLVALNRTHIDYFSLDVEGVELDVLKTIPFDKIDISVLTVEFAHGNEGRKSLEDFMTDKGYVVVDEVIRQDHLAWDLVFKKST